MFTITVNEKNYKFLHLVTEFLKRYFPPSDNIVITSFDSLREMNWHIICLARTFVSHPLFHQPSNDFTLNVTDFFMNSRRSL